MRVVRVERLSEDGPLLVSDLVVTSDANGEITSEQATLLSISPAGRIIETGGLRIEHMGFPANVLELGWDVLMQTLGRAGRLLSRPEKLAETKDA